MGLVCRPELALQVNGLGDGPVLHIMGNNPAIIGTTAIIFGRTRSTAPIMMASYRSFRV